MSVSLVDLVAAMHRFLTWWRDELVAMVPLAWRERFVAHIPRAVIRPGKTCVEIELVDGRERQLLLETAPLEGLDDEAWAQLDSIIRSRRSVIVLAHPKSYVAYTDLPRGAVGHAGRVIDLQMDRLSPLKTEYIHWNWAAEVTATGARAAVAMVRRVDIEALDRMLADRGVPMPAIAAAHEPAPIAILEGFDGSDTPQRRLDRRLGWIALALVLTIPLTSLAALATAQASARDAIATIEDEVGPRLRADARTRRAADAVALARPVLARPAVSGVLSRLTAVLPADGRLAALRLGDDGGITLTIEGVAAATLQPLLAAEFREAIVIDGAEVPAPGEQGVPGAPTGASDGVRVVVEVRP